MNSKYDIILYALQNMPRAAALTWLVAVICVFLMGCAIFDLVDVAHKETVVKERVEINPEPLVESGFTDEQIAAIVEALKIKVETETVDHRTKVRGKAAEEFELSLPGMALSAFRTFDPGAHSRTLYIMGGVILVAAAVGGYLLGKGVALWLGIAGVGCIVLGRVTAMPYAGVTLLALGVMGFVGYVVWRLYRGKVEHEVLCDVAPVVPDARKKELPKRDRIELERNR